MKKNLCFFYVLMSIIFSCTISHTMDDMDDADITQRVLSLVAVKTQNMPTNDQQKALEFIQKIPVWYYDLLLHYLENSDQDETAKLFSECTSKEQGEDDNNTHMALNPLF